jgi:class 3 adenylate cyclase/putative methionine-R-sulfoxide reductase with GAF domain
MKRRSKTGSQKGQRQKTLEPKGRNTLMARPQSSPATEEIARLTRENVGLLSELRQCLDQGTATSEVLSLISCSTFDLAKVLNTVLELAAGLSKADKGVILRNSEGASYYAAATYQHTPEFIESQKGILFEPGRGGVVGRVLLEGKSVQITDVFDDPEYVFRDFAERGGFRTILCVPLVQEGAPIGLIVLHRAAVKPFTEKQIKLVEGFATQAVIAIENARLLNELRQRTSDLTERTTHLTEALEQQTATSEVLQVISSSPGDLQPVFASMLENATRICDAKFGSIARWEGEALHYVATHNLPPAFAEYRLRSVYRPDLENPLSRMFTAKAVLHIPDLAAERAYIERRDPGMVAAVELGGAHTAVAVPMVKKNEFIGLFLLYRQEVRPFTDKQIALITNFAAQAVIALENARLLNELRQRTTDLTETLEQQTATSQVLQVISTSPGDLEPVFTTMLAKAVRICDASFGNIYRWDGEFLNHIAAYNTPVAFLDVRKRQRISFTPEDPVGRTVVKKNVVHTADLAEERGYIERTNSGIVAAVELGGIRTHVVVPMLKDDDLIGTFHLSRQEVRPFTDKQIELVTNFAAQAVIAIENTRLLKELRERTEEVEKLNQGLEQRVADQVDEIERMSRLRRFLPPQVADLIVASGSEKQLESHRREITALFCDLRGFTGFTESADAEDVMALLRDYHAAIGEIIIKYNGTLERYAGDGVMVVFNDPVPVENPALQAVLMALEVRGAIGALTERWRRWGHDLGFGIGIAHGFATLGTIGFEGRFDYAAIGTVSNVASRLCDEAKPGQILISARVLTKVENAVKVEPVGEFELKGIRRPLAAYNVIGTAAKDDES